MSDLIDRQAAIDAVERNSCNTQRAIDAVNALPSVQPEPCSDAISRQGAIDHFKSITVATSIGNKYNEGFVDGLNFAVGHLETMPSVQPTYTDAEVQKMQDLHQAEIEKAFDLGREDTKAEIARCKDCKFWTHNEELTPEEAASEIASGSIMSASYWLDLMIRLKQMGYAICRKE